MHLSDEALAEFRALWDEDHTDETLSDAELRDMAIRLLRAVEAVCQTIPTDDEND